MTTQLDTIVIGAGIAGLAYAHARGRDADLLVLDAAGRAGGLVSTASFDGGHYERGPESLQSGSADTMAMLEELGLAPHFAAAEADRRWVLRVAPSADEGGAPYAGRARWRDRTVTTGRLVEVPSSPPAFLRSPILSWRGRLRALAEPFRRADVALDGSVADFFRHRVGQEVVDWLVDPFVSGIYAGDVTRLSIAATFPMLPDLVRAHGSLMRGMKARARTRRERGEARQRSVFTFPGGLGRLPEALGRALGDRLRLNAGAVSLQSGRDGRWVVATPDAGLHARKVVVALPARAAAGILEAALPALASELRSVEAESVVTVSHLWTRTQVRHPLNGFGYLVPSALGMRHLGTLFSSTLDTSCCPPGTVLLRTFLGGARDPRAVDAPDEALLDVVATEVAPVLGMSGPPRWQAITRWPAVLPRYDLGHPDRLERIRAALAAAPGIELIGNYLEGISVPALIERSRRLARGQTVAA